MIPVSQPSNTGTDSGNTKNKYQPETIPVSQQLAVGIDIGGTNTVFGIVDHRGEIKYRGAISTRKNEKIEDYLDELYAAVEPAIDHVGGKAYIKGVGIGAPNANYYTGNIEYAPNLIWKGMIPLADLMTKNSTCPVPLPTMPTQLLWVK